jgi:hypothetical protein
MESVRVPNKLLNELRCLPLLHFALQERACCTPIHNEQ